MDDLPEKRAERRLVWGAYLASAALLVGCCEPIVLGRIASARYHNFDLGIYGQAIYRLSWSEPNPWLTLRETRIFNDHFDPILWIAAPVAKGIEPAMAGALVELAFVLASPLAVVWLWQRALLNAPMAAVAIFYLLHGRGTILAILYPFHPTTWAILPMAALSASMLADRRRAVVVSLVALCCCKEEFPLVGLMAALVYGWRREFRFALIIGGISAAWLAVAMYLRLLLFGSVTDYVAIRLVAPEGLPATLERAFNGVDWRGISHVLLPLAPIGAWLVWRRERPPLWLWLLLVPPLALRFLGRSWGYHYIAALAPPLVLGLLPLGADKQVPKSVLVSVVALIVAINAGFLLRSARSLWIDRPWTSEPWQASRLESIARGSEYLKSHPQGQALVQGNLVPRLVMRPELYQIGGVHDPAAHTFRYVFLEQPPHGDLWPLTLADYQHLLAQWRAVPGVRILIDDEHVFLATGEFRDRPRK
jgi:uncharacterized membrane protein